MSQLLARRTELHDIGSESLSAIWRAAAREGVLHAGEELVVCGFGTASSCALRGGLGDVRTPLVVSEMLGDIELTGAEGPGGTGVLAVGSLPFRPGDSASMWVPELLCSFEPGADSAWVTEIAAEGAHRGGDRRLAALQALGGPAQGPGGVVERHERLSGDGYREAVVSSVARLRAGELTKVVLARSVVGTCVEWIDPAAVAASLHEADTSCSVYSYAVPGGRLVGASPELIVATSGRAVSAHPLAGTVALEGDGDDAGRLEWLLASAKNRVEHSVVVDDIMRRLAPLCDTLGASDAPSIVRLSTDARLGTWIDGKLQGDPSADLAMRVLAALHPTPAVGGVPRERALELIDTLEGAPRGQWAGPVGWVDAGGTSTWTLALRSLLVDQRHFEAWAGAGIVAESDPEEERLETAVKLASVLRVLSA